MNIHNADLAAVAVKSAQYPKTKIPEIALAGRSNVGKSSFINKILNRKSLARTSSTPGKTATLNFYNIDNCLFLVDLPGYGFAKVSPAERERWGEMINKYLSSREQLCQTLLLLDARHKPTADDVQMYNWIKARHGYAVIIVTKLDKLKKAEVEKNVSLIKSTLNSSEDDKFILFSAVKGDGRDEALKLIEELTGGKK